MAKIKKQVHNKEKKIAKPKMKVGKKKQVKKVKPVKETVKNDFSSMSVDEFLNKDFEYSDQESDELYGDEILDDESEMNVEQEEKSDSDEPESDLEAEENSEDEAEKHKRDLEKLKDTDPEFYKFLQENDKKLLQFNLSDEENEEEDNVEDVHKPTDDLEVASDESDFEGADKPIEDGIITLKMLKKWQGDIKTDKSNKTIITLIDAFHAAMFRVTSHEEDIEPSHFKVDGSSVFNGVIQLCMLELGPAIRRFLRLQQGSKQPPHKCKKFIKIKRALNGYFTDLLKLLMGVTSANIQTVLLKHLHQVKYLLKLKHFCFRN